MSVSDVGDSDIERDSPLVVCGGCGGCGNGIGF